jgi:acetylglutamate kinase
MTYWPVLQAGVITDLVLLWTVGIRPVLVHGGGPEINGWLTKLGIQPEFKNGLRVTDGERGSEAAPAGIVVKRQPQSL